MKFNAAHSDLLFQLLTWRRDVRHFRPDPVPEKTVARLHQAMELAPSVGNSRPWRVLRVESAEARGGVKEEFRRCNVVAAAAYSGQRQADYAALKLAGLDQAPLHLAIFCETDPAEGHGLGRGTMPETLMQSTSMAIFALWLAARADNLGVGMVSILDPRRVEALLGVPPNWRFAAYLCVGHPAFDDDVPLLHRTEWQENVERGWVPV